MKKNAPCRLTDRLIGEGNVIFDDFIISVKDQTNATFAPGTSEKDRAELLAAAARNSIPTANWGGNGGVYKLNRLQEGHQYTVTYRFGFEPLLSTAIHTHPPDYTFTYSANMTELPTMVAPRIQVTGRVVSPPGTGLKPSVTLGDLQIGVVYPGRPGDGSLRLVKTNEQGEYTFFFEHAASGEVFLWGRDESIPLLIADRDILLPVPVHHPE